jgi:hypothetical protein
VSPGRLATWLLAAAAIGVGAFLIGHGGGGSQAPSMPGAEGARQMTLPGLTAVAPLPKMETPPRPQRQQIAEVEATSEEPSAGETTTEFETYEEPVEETSSAPEESSGSNGAESTATPTVEEPAPEATESAPSGGGEKLVPEG